MLFNQKVYFLILVLDDVLLLVYGYHVCPSAVTFSYDMHKKITVPGSYIFFNVEHFSVFWG